MTTGTIAITGGAGGIGAALVRIVQSQGGRAVSLDLKPNPEAFASHTLDLTDEAAIADAFRATEALTGLVCIAGTNARGRCLLYTSPSPRDAHESRMPSSA